MFSHLGQNHKAMNSDVLNKLRFCNYGVKLNICVLRYRYKLCEFNVYRVGKDTWKFVRILSNMVEVIIEVQMYGENGNSIHLRILRYGVRPIIEVQ